MILGPYIKWRLCRRHWTILCYYRLCEIKEQAALFRMACRKTEFMSVLSKSLQRFSNWNLRTDRQTDRRINSTCFHFVDTAQKRNGAMGEGENVTACVFFAVVGMKNTR